MMSGSIVVFNSSQFQASYNIDSVASGSLSPGGKTEPVAVSGQNSYPVYAGVSAEISAQAIAPGTITSLNLSVDLSQTGNVVDEDGIQWTEFRSKYGEKYQVGHPIAENCPEVEDLAAVPTRANFGHSVNWPVLSSSNFIVTDGNTKTITSIEQYASYGTPKEYFKYILYISNSPINYNYIFFDESGDYYTLNTYRNGNHYVRYNSVKPQIAFITGN